MKERLKSNVELGKELGLFIFNKKVGGGLPLLTPRGTAIKREIERFIVDEELKRGYQFTDTPIMAKSDLYKTSGHWDHFKQDMFTLKVGSETFALRPMTCPFQFMIYRSKPRSYRELPIRYAEISRLFRNEKKGELMGLTRMRQFTLADAHVICTPEQLEQEFEKVLDLTKYVMKVFGIKDIWYRFSKWDKKNTKGKYIDNPQAWGDSQRAMKKILDKLKLKYVEANDEAAFYGPKLDIQYKNVFGKEDTLITIQIDFALPERFKLEYVGEDNKKHSPMVIHHSSGVGCLERTMAYLLEKTQGKLPTWLAPVQVKVINFTDRNLKACEKFVDKLKMEGIRIETDFRSVKLPAKIKEAELMKVPYIVVIGDKEEKSKSINVRKGGKVETEKQDAFVKSLVKEIAERK